MFNLWAGGRGYKPCFYVQLKKDALWSCPKAKAMWVESGLRNIIIPARWENLQRCQTVKDRGWDFQKIKKKNLIRGSRLQKTQIFVLRH